MKNGEEIDFQETPGFAIGASGQKLVIQSAKVENTGDYECIAENDAGTDRLQYRLEVYGEWNQFSLNCKILLTFIIMVDLHYNTF